MALFDRRVRIEKSTPAGFDNGYLMLLSCLLGPFLPFDHLDFKKLDDEKTEEKENKKCDEKKSFSVEY
jgi:hypothetical protein